MFDFHTSKVTRNVRLGGDYYVITLEYCPTRGNPRPEPGHFVMMRPKLPGAPLLPRPMSILAWRCSSDGIAQLDVFYKVHGKGTEFLRVLQVDDYIDLLGPLGNPFPPDVTGRVLMVAGGVGLPPLVYWAKEHVDRFRKGDLHMFIGGRTGKDIFFERDLNRIGVEVTLATENGDRGEQGYVTKPFERYLNAISTPATVMTCGPMAMMQAVARISAEHDMRCLASMEAYMACGYGVCLGCVVPDAEGRFVRVCVEGPVFDTAKLDIHSEYLGGL
jgi:dihydroorotate dehydrogenase electron transfer subunit